MYPVEHIKKVFLCHHPIYRLVYKGSRKFQSFKTEKLLSKKGFEKKYAFQSRWKKSVWEVYKDAELPREWHKELNQYAKKIGIHFFTSPWDYEAVSLLKKLKEYAKYF